MVEVENIGLFLKNNFKKECIKYWSSQQTRNSKYTGKREVKLQEFIDIVNMGGYDLILEKRKNLLFREKIGQ